MKGFPARVRFLGDLQYRFPPTPLPLQAREGECYPAPSLVASAVAAPRGLQGEPRLRRLLSSSSLRLRLPGSGSAPSTGAGRGSRKTAEEPTRAGAQGNQLESDLQGAAPNRSADPLRASLGSPDCPQGSPLFRFPHCPTHLQLVLDKDGKVPHHHKDHQLLVGKKTLLEQSDSLIRSPKGGLFLRGGQGIAFLFSVVQRDP